MSHQNDSRKSGVNAKSKANTKTSETPKSNATKGKLAIKAGSRNTSTQGRTAAQRTTYAHNKNAAKGFQVQDIKSLIHNQGRANLGGQEWSLKAPSWSNSTLQAIISDPKLTARPTGKPAADGYLTFELRGHGKTINVTIGH